MKRSSQIALVVMGVVTATATAGYMARRSETACEPQAQGTRDTRDSRDQQPACSTSRSSSNSTSRSRTVFPIWWGRDQGGTARSSVQVPFSPSAATGAKVRGSAGTTSRGGFGSAGFSSGS